MSPEIAAAPLPDVGVLLHGLPSEDLCLDFLQAISDDGELPQLLPPSGKGGGTQAGQAAAAPANATAASAPPSAGGEPYGRQWGWNADALTVQRNEHTPAPHCSEPWSQQDALSSLLGALGGANLPGMPAAAAAPAHIRPPCNKRNASGEMLGHNIRCLVPGCHSDLLREREFNLRNKICEFHQRAKVLVVEGAEHRFCQQCTRLHPIDAFDGNKRGCRSRLERHNKRRRLANIITKGLDKPEDEAVDTSKPEGGTSNCEDVSQSSLVLDACNSESGAPQPEAPRPSDNGSSLSHQPLPPAAPAEDPGQLPAEAAVSAAELTPVPAPTTLEPPQPASAPRQASPTHACRGPGCNLCAAGSQPMSPAALAASAAGSVGDFRKAVSFSYDVVEHCVFNFAMKIIGAAPDTLPPNLKQELRNWMQVSPVAVQGFIRFGCLHLSVDVTTASEADMAAALRNLPAGYAASVASGGRFPWCVHPTTAVFPGATVVAASGAVVPAPAPAPHRIRPAIHDVERLAVADGVVRLRGTGLRQPGVRLMARVNKEFFEMEVEAVEVLDEAADVALLTTRVPYEAGLGQAWVEALLDAPEAFLVSPPAALLLTDCPLIAAEVCQLRTGRERMPANAELKLLRELAALLHPVSGAGFPVAAALALAGFAASCGWPEAMDRALERALEALPLEAALRALEATHGTSLLSAAVISGSPATVTRVLAFMAETGSFDLARVDKPSGALGMSPMQWAELQGVPEITRMLVALRQQGASGSGSHRAPQAAADPDATGLEGPPESEAVPRAPAATPPPQAMSAEGASTAMMTRCGCKRMYCHHHPHGRLPPPPYGCYH